MGVQPSGMAPTNANTSKSGGAQTNVMGTDFIGNLLYNACVNEFPAYSQVGTDFIGTLP